ncbi:hypothetical protein ACHAXS_001737, partial [Conticribra weissflogii]
MAAGGEVPMRAWMKGESVLPIFYLVIEIECIVCGIN